MNATAPTAAALLQARHFFPAGYPPVMAGYTDPFVRLGYRVWQEVSAAPERGVQCPDRYVADE